MSFDPTITFGAILNAAVLLVGFVVAFTRIGGRIDLLSQKVESSEKGMTLRLSSVETQLQQMQSTDRRLTIMEERVTNHVKMLTTAQQDISDLRRGQGFIQTTRQQGGVDGEWP